jgi:hypothetical protein
MNCATPKLGEANDADLLVAQLLEQPITEATIRLPPRSRRWLAIYTGPDGQQIARSTQLSDRKKALALARRWEAQARNKRMRRIRPPIPLRNAGLLTQAQVAAVLRISERGVREIEKRAIAKLRRHPLLRRIWAEFSAHHPDLDESLFLTRTEANALLSLARTPFEIQAIKALLFVAGVRSG